MSFQDWDPVTIDKRGRRAPGESKAEAVARASRSGGLVSERRFEAAANPAAHATAAVASARKLEEDTESFAHATVDRTLAQAIQQARLAKKMTQKELAAAVAEKPSVIAEYESGKAIPNGPFIVKLERALDTRLPRPPKKK